MDGAEQAFHAVTGAMYKNPCDQDALRRMADERIAQILIVSRTSALRAPRVGSALGLGDERLAVCPGAHTAPGALMSASRASRACSTDAVFTDSRVDCLPAFHRNRCKSLRTGCVQLAPRPFLTC